MDYLLKGQYRCDSEPGSFRYLYWIGQDFYPGDPISGWKDPVTPPFLINALDLEGIGSHPVFGDVELFGFYIP